MITPFANTAVTTTTFHRQVCQRNLREARAEVRRANRHLETARDTRNIYLKEMVEQARWDRYQVFAEVFTLVFALGIRGSRLTFPYGCYQKEHHIRHPHYLNIPSGREVQDALHDAEKELAHALADRAKAEIAIHNARLARKHFRSTRGRFCIDMDS